MTTISIIGFIILTVIILYLGFLIFLKADKVYDKRWEEARKELENIHSEKSIERRKKLFREWTEKYRDLMYKNSNKL